jgi:LPLT family lysophospholipid transporter-like MFS transporter
MLQGIVAIGVAGGAILAALGHAAQSVRVIPLGIAMGVVVIVMAVVRHAGWPSRCC